MLWLEQDGAWESRGATAHGEILGVGASSAAVAMNEWPDASAPLVRTMRLALDDAGIEAWRCGRRVRVRECDTCARSRRSRGARRAVRIGVVRGDVSERIARRVWRLGQRGVHRRIAVRQGGPRAADLRASRSRTPAAGTLRLATAAVDAPGPIALVNSFACGRRVVQCRAARCCLRADGYSFNRVIPSRPRRHRHRRFARHR